MEKIVFPVPSWANKISLRDAPANPENGGLITQNTVIISLPLGIAFVCVCVCGWVCAQWTVIKHFPMTPIP